MRLGREIFNQIYGEARLIQRSQKAGQLVRRLQEMFDPTLRRNLRVAVQASKNGRHTKTLGEYSSIEHAEYELFKYKRRHPNAETSLQLMATKAV